MYSCLIMFDSQRVNNPGHSMQGGQRFETPQGRLVPSGLIHPSWEPGTTLGEGKRAMGNQHVSIVLVCVCVDASISSV